MALGGPGNTYQWSRDGSELTNEILPTLTLENITAANGAEYTCTVSNAAGNDTATTTLNVAAEILVDPVDVSSCDGTMSNLTCEAEGFPAPTYRWEHAGGIESNVFGEDTNTLQFLPVLFGNEGIYFCVASSGGTTAVSQNATLTGMLIRNQNCVIV